MNWNLEEAISYYRTQGAPGDQSVLIRLLREVAKAEGMNIAQLAIAFMRDCAGVTSLVLGADNPEQVKDNIGYFDVPELDKSTMAVLEKEFAQVDIPAIMQVLSRPKQ